MKLGKKINGVVLPSDFIVFLKENNIYTKYINNFKKAKNLYNQQFHKSDLMMTFNWPSNEIKFWSKMDRKWLPIALSKKTT